MKTALVTLVALLTFSTAWADSLVGVGLMLRQPPTNGPVIIQQIVSNSPAAKAGIKPNSRLVSVDGVGTGDISLAKCVNLIRGAPDTQVTLGIVDPASQQTNLVTLTRATLQLPRPPPGRLAAVRPDSKPGPLTGITGIIIGCVIGIAVLVSAILYWNKKQA